MFAHLHVVGDDTLPNLHRKVLAELITLNGVATQKLLAICEAGLHFEINAEKKVTRVTLEIPLRKDKVHLIDAKVHACPTEETRQDPRGRAVCKKYSGEGNSYGITAFNSDTNRFTVRLFETYTGTIDGKPKTFTDKLSANFLQAVFSSFFELPFSGVPDMIRIPSLKQTAEQLLSHVLLKVDGEQDAGVPSIGERNPHQREIDWRQSLDAIAFRTEPFVYEEVPANGKKKRVRFRNATPDWEDFLKKPFAARLPIKIPPQYFGVFWRTSEGTRGKRARRLYMAIDLRGIQDSHLWRLLSENEDKLFWWRRHIKSFEPVPFAEKFKLTAKKHLIMIPLEYDMEERFSGMLSDPLRKMCLLTLKETRNTRKGRKNRNGNQTLKAGKALWRADFATSKEVSLPKWNCRILGIHFEDSPVMSWALLNKEGELEERGTLEGNPILESGLVKQETLQAAQKKDKWVGDRGFQQKLRTLTAEIARKIVLLAAEKDAWIVLEDIQWVPKSSKDSKLNRRYSMWNFSALPSKIEWLGIDIVARGEAPHPAPLACKVNDYVIKFTCPECDAIRKAGQKPDKADTIRTKEGALECRKCGFKGVIPPKRSALLVAQKGFATMIKKIVVTAIKKTEKA